MEDLYAVPGATAADVWNTPYPVAVSRLVDHWVRETDDPPAYGTPPSPRSARQQLARALRWHRTLNGWSQEALGLAAGLDRSYVGAVERMEVNISFDNAEKLAQAFGLSLVGLLGTEVPGCWDCVFW